MEYLSDDEISELVRNIKADFWCAAHSETRGALYINDAPLDGQEEYTEYAQKGMKPTHEAFNQEKVKAQLEQAQNGDKLTLFNSTLNLYSEQLIAIKTKWGWVKFDDFMLAEYHR